MPDSFDIAEIVVDILMFILLSILTVGIIVLIFGCPRLIWAPESDTGRYQVIIATAGVVQADYISKKRNGGIYCIRGNYLLPDGTMYEAAETTTVTIKPINE